MSILIPNSTDLLENADWRANRWQITTVNVFPVSNVLSHRSESSLRSTYRLIQKTQPKEIQYRVFWTNASIQTFRPLGYSTKMTLVFFRSCIYYYPVININSTEGLELTQDIICLSLNISCSIEMPRDSILKLFLALLANNIQLVLIIWMESPQAESLTSLRDKLLSIHASYDLLYVSEVIPKC